MAIKFHEDNLRTIYLGDARNMSEIPDESVHCCVTSPPYFGLRRYSGLPDLVWDGDEKCQHQWRQKVFKQHSGRGDAQKSAKYSEQSPIPDVVLTDSTCSLCGAWKGQLGLEPSPELYISHLIQILREAKRVLRPDGVVWWNIGDSHAGSWGNYGVRKGGQREQNVDKFVRPAYDDYTERPALSYKHPIIKPLDLCLIPFRFAIAAQEDGWFIRCDVIWQKGNVMPESVNGWRWERHRVKIKSRDKSKAGIDKMERLGQGNPYASRDGYESEWQDCPGCGVCKPNDGLILRKGSWRPTISHEYIFQMVKSPSYFCDMEAVREPVLQASIER